jgi:hypothetical protein
MIKMSFEPSDYIVTVNAFGLVMKITRSDSVVILPDPTDPDFIEFYNIDTLGHICERVTAPDPEPLPTQEERIAAMEDALLALTGV